MTTTAAGRPVERPPVPEDEASAPAASPPTGTVPASVPAGGRPPLSRRGRAVLAVVAAGLLVVLATAPITRLAGARPIAPRPLSTVVTRATSPVSPPALHRLPEGLPPGATVTTSDDVRPYAAAALGPQGGEALMAALHGGDYISTEAQDRQGHIPYPYRFPTLEPILDAAPDAAFRSAGTALGAALTLLAAQPPFPDGVSGTGSAAPILNAAPAAFAVLDRARATGTCAPQLDLLILLAADQMTNLRTEAPNVLLLEQRRTESVCPNDPAPAWLVGQGQLRYQPASRSAGGSETPSALPAGVVTMQELVAQFPRSALAHTGLGDAYLSEAAWLQPGQPFTARARFRTALAEYNRAAELGGGREAAPGQARALIGVGDPARAAELLSPLLADSRAPGGLLEIAVAADEGAHRFGAAERLARRLDELGPASYPTDGGMVPDPGYHVRKDTLGDTSLPLSLGTEFLSPLRAQVVAAGGAGGSAGDVSFIPQYRESPGVTGTFAACAGWSWRRDAVLAGHAEVALADWPDTLPSARIRDPGCPSGGGTSGLRAVGAAVAGNLPAAGGTDRDAVFDEWQNLLRWAGDLAGARRVAERWQTDRGDASATPALRLGEIEYLQGEFDDAAVAFRIAGRATRLVDGTNDLAVIRADLDRAAAELGAGRKSDAEATLRPLDYMGAQGFGFQRSRRGFSDSEFAAVSYYASMQLGDLERESGRPHAAVTDYEAALAWVSAGVSLRPAVRTDVLANNAALAYLAIGDTDRAAGLVRKALDGDPENPIFLMTAGFVADRRGDVSTAAGLDRAALDNDPGAYPAANDMGVELAHLGRPAEAERAFRQAVGARPDYALGWFNLGVLDSGRGPVHLLAAEDAFGRAYALDPALRDRKREFTIDGSVYRTALDLSKPLPPAWSLMNVDRPAPVASVGLLVLVTAGLGLARATTRQGAKIAEQWLEPAVRRLESLPVLRRVRHPAWAVAATAGTFFVADLRRTTGLTELLAYAAGVLAVVGAAMLVRPGVAARTRVAEAQLAWAPGILFGLTAGALGFPWAPLPVVQTDEADGKPGVHLAAPLALAGIALVLFLESAWVHTPLTQAWAVAALVMAASVLLPVRPLDGALAGKAGVATSIGLVATTVFVAVGLL